MGRAYLYLWLGATGTMLDVDRIKTGAWAGVECGDLEIVYSRPYADMHWLWFARMFAR